MLKVKDIKGFRTWLEEASITPEALEWVDSLTDEEVAAMMRYLRLNGIAFLDGRPMAGYDDDRLWYLLDEAMVCVHAMREEKRA